MVQKYCNRQTLIFEGYTEAEQHRNTVLAMIQRFSESFFKTSEKSPKRPVIRAIYTSHCASPSQYFRIIQGKPVMQMPPFTVLKYHP